MRLTVSMLVSVAVVLLAVGTQGLRRRRSVLALPSKTSSTVTFDISVPVAPLRSNGGYYNMRLPFRFFIPTVEELSDADGSRAGYDDDVDGHDQRRSHDQRRFIYKNMESLMSSFGFDGLACLQRAICELSDAPIAHNDMLGSILNLLLTPPQVSETGREMDTCDNCEIMNQPYHDDYVQAYHHGQEGRCATQYGSACPVSFWKIFEV